jgi:transposase
MVMMMRKGFQINETQVQEIVNVRKSVSDKRVDKRLWAIQLRGEGMKNPRIAEKLDTSAKVVSRWVSAYCKSGITALLGGKFGGNRRNMSFESETQFLSEFETIASKGQIVEVGEIEKAYEKLVGHSIGGSQIYRVLHRHGWRKVMPRSKHPNRASDEAIEASKKLTQNSNG